MSEQSVYRSFKSRLTRKLNQKDCGRSALQGIVDLWNEFESYPWSRGLPDDWRRWERAAEDALFAMQRLDR